jgi:prolyl-tRNA editing enzyme YbaK/EbsC (Cys-tRNA(Pro) deacylase)
MSHAWPEPVERVSAVLRAAAVDARVEQFDEGTPTARDAAKAVACELSQIVKTLVFVCDGAFVLALVPGDRRADERAVAQAVGASSVRVAKADEVVQATGFEAGGVAPFPQLQVSQTLIDSSFFAHGIVWIGAGTPHHMASLPPLDHDRQAGARTVDLAASG